MPRITKEKPHSMQATSTKRNWNPHAQCPPQYEGQKKRARRHNASLFNKAINRPAHNFCIILDARAPRWTLVALGSTEPSIIRSLKEGRMANQWSLIDSAGAAYTRGYVTLQNRRRRRCSLFARAQWKGRGVVPLRAFARLYICMCAFACVCVKLVGQWWLYFFFSGARWIIAREERARAAVCPLFRISGVRRDKFAGRRWMGWFARGRHCGTLGRMDFWFFWEFDVL